MPTPANFKWSLAQHLVGLDLDSAARDAGIERKFPGSGRDILDPAYDRYVAPQFPRRDTP